MDIFGRNYEEYRLDNGLLVAILHRPTDTIAGVLRVHHGALREEPGEEGYAHFLEHILMSGGSERYTLSETDSIRDSLGYFNAGTYQGRTIFPAHILAEDLELYLDFVSQITFHPTFDGFRLEEERHRILREIADEKSKLRFNDNRAYRKALFKGGVHSYYVGGDEKVIASATAGDLASFHRRGYHPNSMDLILVGDVPHNVREIVEHHFGTQPSGGEGPYRFPSVIPLEGRTILHTLAPDLINKESPLESSAKMRLGFIVPPLQHEDSLPVWMIARLLGEGVNSRLFTTLSQRTGMAYGILCTYDGSNNVGVFTTEGKIMASRVDEALETIFQEFRQIQDEPVGQQEFSRLRKRMKFWFAQVSESNAALGEMIEGKLDYDLRPEHLFRSIDALTPEKIMETARRYLPSREGNYVLLIRDPLKK